MNYTQRENEYIESIADLFMGCTLGEMSVREPVACACSGPLERDMEHRPCFCQLGSEAERRAMARCHLKWRS